MSMEFPCFSLVCMASVLSSRLDLDPTGGDMSFVVSRIYVESEATLM